jgi:hypothetical protein
MVFQTAHFYITDPVLRVQVSWPDQRVDVDLSDELVGGDDTEEDGEGVESSVNDVKEVKGNVPEATKVSEDEAQDKCQRVQGR